jgi:hypothetical protein
MLGRMRDLSPAPAATRQPAFTLEPPPRGVPGGIRRKLLFGGAINQMGWLFFGFGVLFFWFLALNSEIWSYVLFSGQTGRATGLVTSVVDTRSSESRRRIYAVDYAFSVAGTKHRGTSYTSVPSSDAGAVVDIEYRKSSPQISRIRGMRRYRFSAWAFVCTIFPLVGLGLVVRGLRRGLRDIDVLARGRAAMGVLIAKEPNGVEVNNRSMYDLTFRFRTDDGAEHRGEVSALHTIPIEDEPEERLLYDPRHPERIVVVDNLPGAASIDERGRLTGGGSGVLVLLAPALAAAILLGLVLSR